MDGLNNRPSGRRWGSLLRSRVGECVVRKMSAQGQSHRYRVPFIVGLHGGEERGLFELLRRGHGRYHAGLEAMAYPEHAGTLANNDIAAPQSGHFTDPQSALEHELNQGVIASCRPVGAFPGGAQQAVHLCDGQSLGAATTVAAHRL